MLPLERHYLQKYVTNYANIRDAVEVMPLMYARGLVVKIGNQRYA